MVSSRNGHSRIGRSRYVPFLVWSILGMVDSRNGRVRNCHSRIGRSRIGTSTMKSRTQFSEDSFVGQAKEDTAHVVDYQKF